MKIFCSIWCIFESLYFLWYSVLPSVVGAVLGFSPLGFFPLFQSPSPTSPPPASSTVHPHPHALTSASIATGHCPLLHYRPPHQPSILTPTLQPAPASQPLCLPRCWCSAGFFPTRVFPTISVAVSYFTTAHLINRPSSLPRSNQRQHRNRSPSPTSPPPTSSTFHPHSHAPTSASIATALSPSSHPANDRNHDPSDLLAPISLYP